MSGRVKDKSISLDRSISRHKKRKSRKHSRSRSSDCVIVIPNEKSPSKDNRRKTRKKKRHRSSSISSNSRNSIKRLEIVDSSQKLLSERPEFCRNGANGLLHRSRRVVNLDRRQSRSRIKGKTNDEHAQNQVAIFERRVLYTSSNETERRKKKISKDLEKYETGSSKPRKSEKRRRFSSSSSSSRSSRSTSLSSTSSSSTSSSYSSYEQRKRRKRKKDKLVKKMKMGKHRHKNDKKKINKSKKQFKGSAKNFKYIKSRMEHDRLLNDINIELTNRAKAMAPMTKEQWEKKQSVVKRVYDKETGRHRLIKGDGEVLEEIVNRDRHMEINRSATRGDGEFFQSHVLVNK